MAEVFNILGKEIEFSQERINFVNLKWEYQNLSYDVRAKMLELFPDVDLNHVGNAENFSGIEENKFNSEIKCKRYENINGYIEKRDKYLKTVLGFFSVVLKQIVDQLKENKVYISNEKVLEFIFSTTEVKGSLENVAKYIKKHSTPHVKSFKMALTHTTREYNGYYDDIYHKIENEVRQSERDIAQNGEIADLLVEYVINPFDNCFLAAYTSETYNKLFQKRETTLKMDYSQYTTVFDGELPKSVPICFQALIDNKDFQNQFISSIERSIFLVFLAKKRLFEDNGLCSYDNITHEAAERAAEIKKVLKDGSIPEDDEKQLMIEMMLCDTFEPTYYFVILDKYYDPNGEIQRLAKVMGVDILTHIENQLVKIYDDGDISTYELTLELKQKILDAQKNYCLENSKAYNLILFRQYFLELSEKALTMKEEDIITAFTSIKNGNNTFVEDKGDIVDDDSCILILTRRFKKLNAAKYHDLIRNLGLTDDTVSEEKAYAFYEEGENYLEFEEECFKIVAADLIHDEDLSVQNYSSDKLASGEVVLGYFQYTRVLDLLTDGKCLIITNKRLYTLKEGFTDLSLFQECNAVKKLLLAHLIIKKTDGSEIQLPVSKEIMNEAADMINRLVKSLKGETYISGASSSSPAESAVQSAANTVKQGFGSLFGKKKK